MRQLIIGFTSALGAAHRPVGGRSRLARRQRLLPRQRLPADEFAARAASARPATSNMATGERFCFKPGGAKMVCRTTISGTFETGQIAVRVYVTEREGDSSARLQLFLPVGLYMPPGVKLSVDKGTAYKIPFTWCLTNTCIAGDVAKPALLARWRAARACALEVVDTNMLAVTTSLPLAQFAAVRKGAPRRFLNSRSTSDAATAKRAAAARLDRLDQRLRRERLGQIGEAAGCHRGHPGGVAVVAGDVDDRRLDARSAS